jgi:hypothetical protein
MTTLPRRPVLLLSLALLLAAPAGCAPRKVVTVSTAEVSPLRLTLHARTDVYALDLGGRAPHEYRAELDAGARDFMLRGPGFVPGGHTLKPAPPVDLELEIRNNSPRDVEFDLGGADQLTLNMFGPELVRIDGPRHAALGPCREPPPLPKHVRLAPGESYFEPVTQLEAPHPVHLCRWYWLRPGKYTVEATWHLPGPGLPNGGSVLQSNPVTLTVREP